MSHDRTTVVENEIQTHKYKYGQLQWRNGILQTNNPITAYDPGWTKCCKTYVLKTYNCFVFPAKFFKAHHMTSTGADVNLCDFQKGACQLKDGAFASWTFNSMDTAPLQPTYYLTQNTFR